MLGRLVLGYEGQPNRIGERVSNNVSHFISFELASAHSKRLDEEKGRQKVSQIVVPLECTSPVEPDSPRPYTNRSEVEGKQETENAQDAASKIDVGALYGPISDADGAE